ncbi:hypothetical protein [Tychonema sp. BBK16]|uniref:hypothetical protein n=1 Tax=Tychonema sp. BBK16 TaxID=2699888 RepID=UPI001F17C394|nr:hypothetical protein [Tychonema sp. BBK16]MCF6375624.1 hypothetical protein [Tychonema sp. BBK16]
MRGGLDEPKAEVDTPWTSRCPYALVPDAIAEPTTHSFVQKYVNICQDKPGQTLY